MKLNFVELSMSEKLKAILIMSKSMPRTQQEHIRGIVDIFVETTNERVETLNLEILHGLKSCNIIAKKNQNMLEHIDTVFNLLLTERPFDLLPTQYFVGSKPCESNFVPVQNRRMLISNKPGSGGLWTSPANSDTKNPEWVDWCLYNDFRVPEDGKWDIWKLTLKDNLNIVKLSDTVDVKSLFSFYNGFNFESMTNDRIDGLWVTESALNIDTVDLYGWDLESVLWLTYPVISSESAKGGE